MNGLCASEHVGQYGSKPNERLKQLLSTWGPQMLRPPIPGSMWGNREDMDEHYPGYWSDCCAYNKLSYVIGPAKQNLRSYVQEIMPHQSAEEQLRMEQTLVAENLAAVEAEEIQIQHLAQIKLEEASRPKPRSRTKIARKQQKKNEKKQQKKDADRLQRNKDALIDPAKDVDNFGNTLHWKQMDQVSAPPFAVTEGTAFRDHRLHHHRRHHEHIWSPPCIVGDLSSPTALLSSNEDVLVRLCKCGTPWS